MTYESNQVVSEIAVLYELALAVGQTLDFQENCDRFLKTLMARKDLAYASVWIRKGHLEGASSDEQSMILMYANPGFRIRERTLPADHPILQRLEKQDVFAVGELDSDFLDMDTEKRIQSGTFAIFTLGKMGFLKLYSVRQKGVFDHVSLNRLRQVITKFSVSLEACVAYGNMSREITERQRAELEAKENASRLSRMMEELPDGICVLNKNREIILQNTLGQAYLDLLGVSREDGTLMTIAKVSLEDLSANDMPTEVILDEENARIFELDAHRVDEVDMGVEWLVKIRDVTRERAVQERTHQQERLAAVGQLAAGIGHDLNNILTPVMGFAQLIQLRDDISQEVKGELDRIAQQGERAAMLVRQILDFSRRSVVQRHKLDLVPFVKESMKLLERTLPETIRMVTEVERGNYVIEANPTQLQQLLTNLGVNARDAMPDGGEFRVRLSKIWVKNGVPETIPVNLNEGGWIALHVSDTGCGMSATTIEHIFEPFFTTKSIGKGTGLGMAQVHGIVKQHGGEIVVKSELGLGSEFQIFLPCVDEPVEEETDTQVILPLGNGETVLVVEDEDAVREVMAAMVKQLNYKLLLTTNGKEALSVYESRAEDIALVLTDVVMPEMGGLELAKKLHEQDAQLPIIFMSGYAAGNQDAEQGEIPDTIAGFISKPTPLDVLAQSLADALAK